MTQPVWRTQLSERNVSTPQGGGGAPGTSEVIAANEAAASAIPGLIDGQQVFILSHRSWWRFNANSTAPLVPHVVIASASAGASPRLLRTAYAAPEWRESITDVYIDPGNVTGIANDENKAIFDAPQVGAARLPLLTWQELSRRWGRRNTINTGDLVGLSFQVHVLSGRPVGAGGDPADLDWVNFTDTYPRILGENATAVLGPIALTAFTAQNPAVPAPGGTPATIQIGATVWGPFIGKRIRRVSDGSVAYILRDMGGGVARISQPQLTNEALFFFTPTNVAWAAGNSVVVEDLPDINIQHTYQGFMGSAFGFNGQTNIADLNITNEGGTVPWIPEVADANNMVVYQCTSDRPVSAKGVVAFNSCGIRAGGQFFSSGGMFMGGAVLPGMNASFQVLYMNGPSQPAFGFGAIDFFTYVQGGGVIAADANTFGTFSVWDAIVDGNFNPGGHALSVGGGPNLGARACQLALRSSNTIFGTGSVGKGCRVASGSKIGAYLALPNITGATGDFQLGNSVLGMWGDFATGTYQPPGGIALTWAALAAAAGIAGFGGSAHNHNQDAHVNLASAT